MYVHTSKLSILCKFIHLFMQFVLLSMEAYTHVHNWIVFSVCFVVGIPYQWENSAWQFDLILNYLGKFTHLHKQETILRIVFPLLSGHAGQKLTPWELTADWSKKWGGSFFKPITVFTDIVRTVVINMRNYLFRELILIGYQNTNAM